jgi:hypothetical protein
MSLKRPFSRALALTFGLSLCAAAGSPGGEHGGMIDPDGLRRAAGVRLTAGVRSAAAGGGDHGGMIDPDGRA